MTQGESVLFRTVTRMTRGPQDYEDTYQDFFGVLIDLMIELLDLIMKPFDNQNRDRELGFIIKPFDNQGI